MPIGQQQCRTLCGKLYTVLPRELRGLVYAYAMPQGLDNDDDGVVVRPYSSPPAHCGRNGFCYKRHKCTQGICSSHIWDADYVGLDVKCELIDFWFRTSVFKFSHGFDELIPFVVSDRWNIGISAHSMITRIRLKLCIEGLGDASKEIDNLLGLRLLKASTNVTIQLDNRTQYKNVLKALDACAMPIGTLRPVISALTSLRFFFVLGPKGTRIEFENDGTSHQEWLTKMRSKFASD